MSISINEYLYIKSPPTGRVGPEGSTRVKAPSFRDIGTLMVVGCQPYAGAFLMTGNTPGTHFC